MVKKGIRDGKTGEEGWKEREERKKTGGGSGKGMKGEGRRERGNGSGPDQVREEIDAHDWYAL